MAFLPSMPHGTLVDVFKAYPDLAGPLHEFAHRLMRGPSPLTEGERELLAAYVSSLNHCEFCLASHRAVAARFGVPDHLVDQLMEDVDRAEIQDRLRPIFRYVRKLSEVPARISQDDVDAVLKAGWNETALNHAALVCAYFHFMNRWVDGLGIEANPRVVQLAAGMLYNKGYQAVIDLLAWIIHERSQRSRFGLERPP